MGAMPENDAEVRDIVMLHFAFRSAFILTNRAQESQQAKFIEISRACFRAAILARSRIDAIPKPFWMLFIPERLLQASGAASMGAVGVIPSLEPRLHAWSNIEKREIHISLITRDLLMRVNVAIWDYIFLASRYPHQERRFQYELNETLFGLLLVLSGEDVAISALPIQRALNNAAYFSAAQTTNAQMHFIMGHELAHLAVAPSGGDPADEARADQLGYVWAIESLGPSGSEVDASRGMALPSAVRWLFEVLALDRAVAASLSGWTPDWASEEVRGRASIADLERHSGRCDFSHQSAGLVGERALAAFRGFLVDLGSEGLRFKAEGVRAGIRMPKPREILRRAAASVARTHDYYLELYEASLSDRHSHHDDQS